MPSFEEPGLDGFNQKRGGVSRAPGWQVVTCMDQPSCGGVQHVPPKFNEKMLHLEGPIRS